jgi:hypothetical protein
MNHDISLRFEHIKAEPQNHACQKAGKRKNPMSSVNGEIVEVTGERDCANESA